MAEFILQQGQSVKRLDITATEIRVGRADDNDVVIDDDKVSRYHAVIRLGERGWAIEDLGSANGTFIDELRIRKAAVDRGTHIHFGKAELTFLGDGTGADGASGGERDALDEAPAFPGFRPQEYLGEGPLTRAWAYRDGDGAAWALRVLRPTWAADAEVVQWIDDTVGAWSRIEVDGLMPLERLPTGDGGHVVLREPVADGGTLFDLIREAKRLDQREALETAYSLARTVSQLHRNGFVHGGISAGKVRIDRDLGRVLSAPGLPPGKLARIDAGGLAALATASPQAFEASHRPSMADDVYALGALLHQMVLGAGVAEGNSFEGVRRSAQAGLYKTPDERRMNLVPGLSELIVSCVAAEPTERPATAGEVARALGQLHEAATSRARAAARPVQARERELGERPAAPRKSLRFKVLSWSITIFLVLLINGALYLLYRDRVDPLKSADRREVEEQNDVPVVPQPHAALRMAIERLLDVDRFAEAESRIEAEQLSGKVPAKAAAEIRGLIKRRREIRVMGLQVRIEGAIGGGQGARAAELLATLGGIVGRDDPDYQRLQKELGEAH